MKLFLASEGSKVLHNLHICTNSKSPLNQKVAFVDIASKPYEGKIPTPWIENDRDKLIELGYDVYDYDLTKEPINKLEGFDIVHVGGGNTLYLNMILHQTGYFDKIKQLIMDDELIYSGTSAGSMIVCDDLSIMDLDEEPELRNTFLKHFDEGMHYEGFGLFNCFIAPHFNKKQFINSNKYYINKNTYKNPIIMLQDDKYIWINGNNAYFS